VERFIAFGVRTWNTAAGGAIRASAAAKPAQEPVPQPSVRKRDAPAGVARFCAYTVLLIGLLSDRGAESGAAGYFG